MKKYISFLFLLAAIAPSTAFASFDANVAYGATGSHVLELQEFLGSHGFFHGPYSGNFFSLTLKAVKAFQSANGLPTTGYFGVLSRGIANGLLAQDTASSTEQASIDSPTPSITPSPVPVIVSSTTASTQPVAPATIPAMDNPTPPVASAPAPFVASGEVDISLSSAPASIAIGQSNPVIVSIAFVNNRNEAVQFYRDPATAFKSAFTPKDTGPSWSPNIRGLCNGHDIFAEVVVLQPNQSCIVQLVSGSSPTAAGSLSGSFAGSLMTGVKSGDIFPVIGSISFGPISVQ